MNQKLTESPARRLHSREIAKIISGLLGSLASWNDPEEMVAALDHLSANREAYKQMFEQMRRSGLEVERFALRTDS